MRGLTAVAAVATILVSMMPANAGPWHRWYGPYAGARVHGWGWSGPPRLAYRGFYGGGYGYGRFGGGGFGGGGHQTATGGPSGGRIGGS